MKSDGVIVVGAGLAGLSCAHELAARGLRVLVLEANNVLGGRTASWVQDGMQVESGLHKFLGIYRALPELLRQVGVNPDEMLTWVDDLEYHVPGGPNARFSAAPYRRPISTALSAVGNTEFLPTLEKAKLAAMSVAGAAACVADPLGIDQKSIAEYAQEYGVSGEIVERVVSTSTQAILFLPAREFSAYAALSPAVEGIKAGMTMRIGAFNGGMTDVMMAPIARRIEELGGTIRLGVGVDGLLMDGGRVAGVRCGGEAIRGTDVVLATSLAAAQKLIDQAFGGAQDFRAMLELPSLSAATIQFELDAPLFETDHTHFSSTSLCCFAEQSHTTFRHVPGRLSAILFPPDRFLGMPADEIAACAFAEAASLGIPLREHATRYRVVNHPSDFYAMRPGTERLRPQQSTGVSGLFLAGDYTRQAYSATMEGAVISGRLAAEAVCQ